MADFREHLAAGRAAHTLGRRVVGRELRVRGLERDELAEELVVLGICEFGGVLGVVQDVGPVHGRRELLVARGRGVDVERGSRLDQCRVDGRELDGHR